MEIVLLGTGTAIPIPGRSPASILLKLGGAAALLDIGPGAVHQAAAAGVDPLQLETIFLSHLHSDHTLDLVTLFQVNDSTPGSERTTPLNLYGCRGTRQLYENLMTAYPGIAPRTYELLVHELAEDQFEWNGVQVSTTHSGHTPDSICYRFDSPEGSLVYTGDCAAGASLSSFCEGTDVLICECSFPSGWAACDHMNAESTGKLAAEAGVKRLLVTHLYPPAIQVDLAAQIGRYYAGPIVIVKDGDSFSLNKEK
jgi:ribonuclease BN (tRNA processing enzyme)